jgi:hypothetical protein
MILAKYFAFYSLSNIEQVIYIQALNGFMNANIRRIKVNNFSRREGDETDAG